MVTTQKHDGVRAASASSIEIDFYYAGKRWRERIKLEPSPANLKRASQHRAAILHAIEAGTFDYNTTFPNSKTAKLFAKSTHAGMTVAAYLDDWLERKRKTLKSSTYAGYVKIINARIIPEFGKTIMCDLARSEIRAWASKIDVSNKFIANIFSVFRAALQEAFEDELIPTNPLDGWTYRKAELPKNTDYVDPFTADEQAAICAELNGQGRNLIQFAFWTGLRTSELIALEWGDVDWIRGTISVRRAQTQAASKTGPESTKTRAGNRSVKLLPPALDALKDQREWTWNKGEEIFQNPRTLARWTGDQAIRQTLWAHALKRAGVRYRYPYQTRHTFASMMLSAGENPMWVAQQMGHSDWSMIRRVYGRWMPEENDLSGGMAVSRFWANNPEKNADQKQTNQT
jgi:integrase